jgi:hypothetical protein
MAEIKTAKDLKKQSDGVRVDAFERKATTALLRALVRYCPPDCQVSVSKLLAEADAAIGPRWFSDRYPDCPITLYTHVIPANYALLDILKPKAMQRITAEPLGEAGGAGAFGVIIDSAADGLPMLIAHTLEVPVGYNTFVSSVGNCAVRVQTLLVFAKMLADGGWTIYA